MALLPKSLLPSKLATVAFAHDVFMAAISFGLSMGLRVGLDFAPAQAAVLLPGTLVFTAIAALVFLIMRLYRGVWRYASMSDLLQLARAVSIIIIVFSLLMFLLVRLEGIPRSLPFINWFVLLALLGGPRFVYRLYKDRHLDWKLNHHAQNLIPVLLVGDGDEAGDEFRHLLNDQTHSRTRHFLFSFRHVSAPRTPPRPPRRSGRERPAFVE